jgi:hypothetical protein
MAANYQNMAGAGGNPILMQQPNQQQLGLQQMLFQKIQQQQPIVSGWQANLTHAERLHQVWHM